MHDRLRISGSATTSAIFLALVVSGLVAAAPLAGGGVSNDRATTLETADPPIGDTTLTFEDVDGDGVDDDCQDVTAVVDEAAAAAAAASLDTNSDGVISTWEAAHSTFSGGRNCNHGGFVSQLAKTNGACATATPLEPVPTVATSAEGDEDGDSDACATEEVAAAKAARDAEKAARTLARYAEKDARTLEREAAKTARQAGAEARSAERESARAARRAAKSASHGSGH